jgi:hypothetical protein
VVDYPLVPGPASAIEDGPWHYGADYVTVYFKGDVPLLRQLVPSPFAVDDGLCMAYVCEIVSVADSGAEMVASRPDRTIYHEAAIGVNCKFKERPGIFFPVMWVTTEWSLLRGLLNGYSKRLADQISMTKLHPLNPGLKGLSKGARFGGFCVKGPEKTLSLGVTVERPGAGSDLPPFGATFGVRKFPGSEPGVEGVSEPVEILKSNSRVTDIWTGSGSVQTTLPVGSIEAISGAVYRSGFTISGTKALK